MNIRIKYCSMFHNIIIMKFMVYALQFIHSLAALCTINKPSPVISLKFVKLPGKDRCLAISCRLYLSNYLCIVSVTIVCNKAYSISF